MKIEMTVLADYETYQGRLRQSRPIWSNVLAFPIAPVSAQPPGDAEETSLEAAARMLAPKVDNLGPDGDYPDCRGDFGMNDTISQDTEFEIVLGYPMERPAHLSVTGIPAGALTPALICNVVREAYREIYRLEADGEDIPLAQEMPSGAVLANRPSTDGMFGISMHGITDLVVESIHVFREPSGTLLVEVGIGS